MQVKGTLSKTIERKLKFSVEAVLQQSRSFPSKSNYNNKFISIVLNRIKPTRFEGVSNLTVIFI